MYFPDSLISRTPNTRRVSFLKRSMASATGSAEDEHSRGSRFTWDLFFGGLGEMIDLSHVRCTGPMPEEEPLKRLVALQFIGETKDVLLVGKFKEVEKLGARLHDGKRRILRVVDEHGNTSCMSLSDGVGDAGIGSLPLGSSLKNQSFFCSLVIMLLVNCQRLKSRSPSSD